MSNPITSTYKRYDAQAKEWVTYYFRTTANAVGESETRKFVTSKTKINGQTFTIVNGNTDVTAQLTLYASNIPTSDNSNVEQKLADINDAIGSLQIQDEDLTAIAGLTGTKGFLKKTAAGQWSLDTSTYSYSNHTHDNYQAKHTTLTNLVELGSGKGTANSSGFLRKNNSSDAWYIDSTEYATAAALSSGLDGKVSTSRTINGKALTANITLLASDIKLASNETKTVKQAIDDLVEVANGKSESYVISLSTSGTLGQASKNAAFNSQDDQISITGETSYILLAHDNSIQVNLSSLKVGDIIYLTDSGYPDRWFSGKSGSGSTMAYYFNRMETSKVDLTNYATKTEVNAKVTANTAITGATKCKITYDSKGLVTGGADLAATDIPSLAASKITSGTFAAARLPAASASAQGAMSAAHYSKLEGIQANATATAIDVSSYVTIGSGNGSDWQQIAKVTINGTDTAVYAPVDRRAASTNNTGTKLFLIGAQSQADAGQLTNSNSNCYIGTDNSLYSNGNRLPNVFVQSSTPTNVKAGDIWIDTAA